MTNRIALTQIPSALGIAASLLLGLLILVPSSLEASEEEPIAFGAHAPMATEDFIRLLVSARAVTDRTLAYQVVAGTVVAEAPSLRLLVIESEYDGLVQARLEDDPLVLRNGEAISFQEISPGDFITLSGARTAARSGIFEGFKDGYVLLNEHGTTKYYELSNFAQFYNSGSVVKSYQLPRNTPAVVLAHDGMVSYLHTDTAFVPGALRTGTLLLSQTGPLQPLLDIAPLVLVSAIFLALYLLLQRVGASELAHRVDARLRPVQSKLRALSESPRSLSFRVGAMQRFDLARLRVLIFLDALLRTPFVHDLWRHLLQFRQSMIANIDRIRTLLSRTVDVS